MRYDDTVVAARAFELLTGPCIVAGDMLATLRTGEFHLGHRVYPCSAENLGLGEANKKEAGTCLFTAPLPRRVKPERAGLTRLEK